MKHRFNLWRHALFLASLTVSASTLAAETGVILKADQLRAEAFSDAKVVANVNKNDSVDILNKKGAWLQIKSNGNTGWVRLLTVKRNNAGGSNLAGAVNVATGRSGTGKVVSTTGIRGLSAEDLKTAAFNEAETQKLERLAVTSEEAKQFANKAGLVTQTYPYLTGNQP